MAEGGTKEEEDLAEDQAEDRTLLVQGLTPDMSEERLKLYFENSKIGGDDVESVKIEDMGRAKVLFKKNGGEII